MYLRSRLVILLLLSVALLAAAVVWRSGVLAPVWEDGWLEGIAASLEGRFWLPWAVLGLLVLGQQLAVPQTLMTVMAVVLLGVWQGFPIAFAGTLIGAVVSYLLGRWLGRYPFRRYAGRRITRLSRLVARRGVVSMVVINLVPIGPHGLINLAAGSSHIRFRDFLLGTALGILPVTLVVSLLTHLLLAVGRMPSAWEAFLGMVAAAFLTAGLWLLSRWAWRWLAGEEELRG